jgi:pseudouridine-5'-phosphate glycosidase
MLFSRLSTPVKRVANARLISNVASTKFKISNLVKAALNSGQPVVALESTIISHGKYINMKNDTNTHSNNSIKGMPYPQTVETALAVEDIIVKHGAVPATIAILEGKVHIGKRRYNI